MKDKIIYLVLGILIGSVITAGCFMLFSKNGRNIGKEGMGGTPPSGNFTQGEMPKDREGTNKENMLSSNTTQNNS